MGIIRGGLKSSQSLHSPARLLVLVSVTAKFTTPILEVQRTVSTEWPHESFWNIIIIINCIIITIHVVL